MYVKQTRAHALLLTLPITRPCVRPTSLHLRKPRLSGGITQLPVQTGPRSRSGLTHPQGPPGRGTRSLLRPRCGPVPAGEESHVPVQTELPSPPGAGQAGEASGAHLSQPAGSSASSLGHGSQAGGWRTEGVREARSRSSPGGASRLRPPCVHVSAARTPNPLQRRQSRCGGREAGKTGKRPRKRIGTERPDARQQAVPGRSRRAGLWEMESSRVAGFHTHPSSPRQPWSHVANSVSLKIIAFRCHIGCLTSPTCSSALI